MKRKPQTGAPIVQTPTAPPAPQTTQPVFSFMGMIKESRTLAKTSRSKTISPLTMAKNKIIDALKVQKGYAQTVAHGDPLPRKKGDKVVSTWFSQQNDGWWTSIRYGQQPILFSGNADLRIGSLGDVAKFYDAVSEAIVKGELDKQISELQTAKSAALKNGKKAA